MQGLIPPSCSTELSGVHLAHQAHANDTDDCLIHACRLRSVDEQNGRPRNKTEEEEEEEEDRRIAKLRDGASVGQHPTLMMHPLTEQIHHPRTF